MAKQAAANKAAANKAAANRAAANRAKAAANKAKAAATKQAGPNRAKALPPETMARLKAAANKTKARKELLQFKERVLDLQQRKKLLHPSNAKRFLTFANRAVIKTGVQGIDGKKYTITGIVPSREGSKRVPRERTLTSAIKRLDRRVRLGPSKGALKNVTITLTNANKKHFKDLRSKQRKIRGKGSDNIDNDNDNGYNTNSNSNNNIRPRPPKKNKPLNYPPRRSSGI